MSTMLSKLFVSGGKGDSQQKEFKLNVLNSMTLEELDNIVKIFLSKDPKIQYVDHKGKVCSRDPTRGDMVINLFDNVEIDEILRNCKRVADKFK